MHDLYSKIHENISKGLPVASATVVSVKGATPQEVGAKMLIGSDGKTFGTIGGGCGEAEVWRKARWALNENKCYSLKIDLTESPNDADSKICGGIMDVHIDIWDQDDLPVASAILEQIKKENATILVTVIGENSSKKNVITNGVHIAGSLGTDELNQHAVSFAKTITTTEQSQLHTITHNKIKTELFFELLTAQPTLVIVGAGHIAQPLAQMGKLLDYKVIVLDDRPQYATKERFPCIDLVKALDIKNGLGIPLSKHTYVVLVTRGHLYDEEALRIILPTPVAYIGMIGSRRRVKLIFDNLQKEGYLEKEIERVYAPIGLDIGAQTPEEIALCIIGEIVNIRRNGKCKSLKTSNSQLTKTLI